jgi:transcriptional regulator with XRE-family HTH domain
MAKRKYNRIKAVLGDNEKKNIELADYLKVKPETVSRWVNNKSQPSLIRLYEIADFFEIDVRELLVPNN